MALLTATRPTKPGVAIAPGNVTASDTIQESDLGQLGAYLIILNGNASPDNVTISDGGLTPVANPATPAAVAVANATNRAFYIDRRQVDPVTRLVTVAHTVFATVTYYLLPLG